MPSNADICDESKGIFNNRFPSQTCKLTPSHWFVIVLSFLPSAMAIHPHFQFMTSTHSQISVLTEPLCHALARGVLPRDPVAQVQIGRYPFPWLPTEWVVISPSEESALDLFFLCRQCFMLGYTEQHATRNRAERSGAAKEHLISQLHNHQLLLELVPEKTLPRSAFQRAVWPQGTRTLGAVSNNVDRQGPRTTQRPGEAQAAPLHKASGISRNKNEELPKQGLPKIMECFQCLH